MEHVFWNLTLLSRIFHMNLDYGGLSKLLLFRGEKQPRDDFKILVDLKGTKNNSGEWVVSVFFKWIKI